MSEVVITKWIDDHIKEINSEDSSKDYLEELVVLITELAIEELSPTFAEKTMQGRIYDTIKRIDELWVYAGAHIESKYGIPLFRYGILVFLKMSQFTEGIVTEAFNVAYDQYVNLLDAQVDHRKEFKQPELLKEYFKLLRDVKTYYQDPNEYPDLESRAMGERIVEIYNELLGGS